MTVISDLKPGDKVRIIEEWAECSRHVSKNPHKGKIGTFLRYLSGWDGYPYVVDIPDAGIEDGVWISELEKVESDPSQPFKPGDRVRIVRTYPDPREPMAEDGKLATFVGYNDPNCSIPFKVDVDDGFCGWNVNQIELIETETKETSVPEIGDTVRIVRDDDDERNVGKVVTLSEIRKGMGNNHIFRVKGTDLPSYGWWVADVEMVNDDSVSETKENTVTVTSARELETRLTEAKDELVREREQNAKAIRNLREVEAALQDFRKRVAEKAIEIYDDGDGPWCKSGFEEAMEELDLSDFVKKPYTIEVTLTIPSDNIPDHLNRDNVDDTAIAEILKNATQNELYYWVDTYDTADD